MQWYFFNKKWVPRDGKAPATEGLRGVVVALLSSFLCVQELLFSQEKWLAKGHKKNDGKAPGETLSLLLK